MKSGFTGAQARHEIGSGFLDIWTFLMDFIRGEKESSETVDWAYPLTELPCRPWMPRKGGKPINPFTVIRWATHGKKGHRLRTVMVGGSRCCSDEWAMEFFESLTNSGTEVRKLTYRQQRKDFLNAEAELDAAGI